MAKRMFYMKISLEEGFALISGLGFRAFMDGIPEKPKNMLLLSSAFANAKTDHEHWLDYVDEATLPLLYQDEVYDYGDFCWVDYPAKENKKALTPQQIAELLYLNHYKKPLNGAFFPSLRNRYAYLAHDDHFWTKIYLHEIDDIKAVFQHKILSELQGRKKSIAPFSQQILDRLFDACVEGVVFDFECAGSDSVSYYIVGDIGDLDKLHASLDKLRTRWRARGGILYYESRKKQWRIGSNLARR